MDGAIPKELWPAVAAVRNTAYAAGAFGVTLAVAAGLAVRVGGTLMMFVGAVAFILAVRSLRFAYRTWNDFRGYPAALRRDPVPVVVTLADRATATVRRLDAESGEGERFHLMETGWDADASPGTALRGEGYAEAGVWRAIHTPHGWLLCGERADSQTMQAELS